jgi:hypothetical protein
MKAIRPNAIRAVVSFLMVAAAIGCAGKSNDVSSSNKVGAGPTGRNVKAEECQVGQVFNSEFGCMSSNNRCGQGQGFSTLVNGCISGKIVTEKMALGASSVARLYGRLKMDSEGRRRLADMLRDANLCDSYMMSANSDCQSFIRNGAFIVIDAVDMNIANITIGAGTQVPEDMLAEYLNPYMFTNAMSQYYIRFSQKAKAVSFNFKNGMQILSNPVDKGLSVEVPKGNLGSEQFDAVISYGNSKIGTSDVRRYN